MDEIPRAPRKPAGRDHKSLLDAIRLTQELTAGLNLPRGRRADLVVGCLDLTLEHQAAIVVLYDAELYGSMLAIVRILYESLVRGLWLANCASGEELEKYKGSKKLPKTGEMVLAVESTFQSRIDLLSRFHKVAWSELNDYTHTGARHSTSRHNAGRVEANYTDHEIANALEAATVFGLLAGAKLAALSGQPRIRDEFKAKLEEFSNAGP